MAPWGDAKLFICFLFITCCCTAALAQIPRDCCLRVGNKTIHHHRIVDYSQQISGRGCSIDATILVTKNSRKLCVPPTELWVKEVVKYVEQLRRLCKKNSTNKRCPGVKIV